MASVEDVRQPQSGRLDSCNNCSSPSAIFLLATSSMLLLLSASSTFNAASAFTTNGNGEQLRGLVSVGHRSIQKYGPTSYHTPKSFSHLVRSTFTSALYESTLLSDEDISDEDLIDTSIFDEEGDEIEDPVEIINGTTEGYIVTKLYTVPLQGFQKENNGKRGDNDMLSLSTLFSPEDVTRLNLDPKNITLPAALMLLDPDEYPTQSRARKVVRQRSICISRNENNNTESKLEFNELGKVIARVYPGDVIGFQRRCGSDYYAMQGVPYRAPPFDVPVLYEDDHMAIVNKPSGIVVYRSEGYARGSGARGGGHGRDTLLSALPYVLKPSNLKSDSDNDSDAENIPLRRPQPVHRLDRPTSGLLVVAKTKAAAIHLSQQFEYRKARKTYTAIVNGIPTAQENNEESSSEWNMIDYDLEGKSAITQWRVLRKVKSLHGKDGHLTLVELKPRTGRYHQLRRHMAWVCNSPLVGDTTYDDADDSALRLRKRGLFLCSNEIELEHPYYNRPAGRKEWESMDLEKKSKGDSSLWEEDGKVMVKASASLPDKFESFLKREQERADKFES